MEGALWPSMILVLGFCSGSVSCVACNDYTVYELHHGGSLQLDDVLMQQPPPHSPPPPQGNESSITESTTTCVNITIHSGVYSITAGMSVLGDSVVIEGIGNVVLRIGQNQSSGGNNTSKPGGVPVPGLQFQNNDHVEITGVEIDGSSGLLTFEDVETLVIKSATFRNFDRGSLDIFNCLNVEIKDCLFRKNGQELFLTSREFQGGSGGLSLQYTEDSTFSSKPSFVLRNVSFIQNSALTTRNAISTFSEVSSGNDFTGRGGAIFILLQNQKAVVGEIRNCLFEDNTADLYGGAVYFAFNSEANNLITIADAVFQNNSAFYAGGGLVLSFQVGGSESKTNRVIMTRCTIQDNTAAYGGGVYFFLSISSGRIDGDLGIFSRFNNCSFISNIASEYGAALGVTALNFFESKEETKPSEINNCSFIKNSCQEGGVVSLSYFPFLFSGHNELQNNFGPAVMIIGSKTHLQGKLTIMGTDVANTDKGALYITSHGQLEVKKNTKVFLLGNRGYFGAAIVMSIPNAPTVYSQSLYNPICPLQYEDIQVVPNEWEGVVFEIDGNRAVIGSGVYSNYLSLCSWNSLTDPFFNIQKTYRWDTFEYGRGNRNSAHTSNASSTVFLVQTPAVRTAVSNGPIEGYPGQSIDIDISGYSEGGSLTYTVWRLTENHDHLDFDPTVLKSRNDLMDPVSTSFLVDTSSQRKNDTYILTASTLLVEDTTSDTFRVLLRDCPPGQRLSASSVISGVQYFSCACNTERVQILECGIKNVTLNGRLWAAESPDISADRLYTSACPPRYCQCYVQDTEPDSYCYNVFVEDEADNSLCTCGRSGVLCGECSANGSIGVSVLLNNCVSCSNWYSVLIPLFIIADVLVFILILIFTFPFPTWILPAIFYIQLLPLLTENFPTTFEQVHPGMVYISSAISFYFPYDFCLYQNMTTVVSYSLRFIPAIIACIVIPIVVVLRNWIYRPSTLHGVWLIVLLLYIPTLHASVSVFNCPYVPISRENGGVTYEFRWFHNGSVTCFSDPDHGGLLLLGMLGLVLCVILIPIAFFITLDKIKYSRSFVRLCEALVCHYENDKWWWSTLELFKRVPIVIFVTAFPLNSFPAFFTLTIYHFTIGMVMPYKSKLANYLEVALGSIVALLVLLPQVTVLQEYLDVFTVSTLSSGNSSDEFDILDKCSVNLDLSPMSALLTTFYYLPITIVFIVGIHHLVHRIVKWEKFCTKGDKRHLMKRAAGSFKMDVSGERYRVTTTDIFLEMKELNHNNA